MSSAEADIRALEERRIAAINAKDFDVIAELLADDYVHVHATGRQENREQLIQGWRQRPRRSERQTLEVRNYGDVAVAVGLQLNYLPRDGQEVPVLGRTTQVFRRVGADWKLASFQFTTVQA